MTKIEHDVVLFAQCVAAAFKFTAAPPHSPRGVRGGPPRAPHGCAGVFLARTTRWRRGVRNGDARALRVDAARSNRASRRARVAAVKNCRKTHAFIFLTQDNKKNIVHITTEKLGHEAPRQNLKRGLRRRQ